MGAQQSSRSGRSSSRSSVDIASFDFREEEMRGQEERRRDLCHCVTGEEGRCQHYTLGRREEKGSGEGRRWSSREQRVWRERWTQKLYEVSRSL